MGNIGNVFIHKTSLASTNSFAHNLLTTKSHPKEGTVIYTDFQTAGIGQHGSSWYTEPHKAVTMSVILYPTFLSAQGHFYLTIMASLAVHQACKKYINERRLSIKWPNDIFIDDRKLCGILIQGSILKNNFNSAIIGIGINIYPYEAIPDDLKEVAFLGESELKLKPTLSIIEDLCGYLNLYYEKLKEKEFKELRSEYHDHLYKYGKKIHFYDKSRKLRLTGTVLGVKESGELQLSVNGKIRQYEVKGLKYPVYD